MIDIILGILVIAFALFDYFELRYYRAANKQALKDNSETYEATIKHLKDIIADLSKERVGDKANMSKMINALIAKTANEVRDLNLTDKIKFNPVPEAPPDLVPLGELSDDEWEEQIKKEAGAAREPKAN